MPPGCVDLAGAGGSRISKMRVEKRRVGGTRDRGCMLVRACYALSGTDQPACNAISGTDVTCAGTRRW
eukprot:1627634-Rhodomonas_salina.4